MRLNIVAGGIGLAGIAGACRSGYNWMGFKGAFARIAPQALDCNKLYETLLPILNHIKNGGKISEETTALLKGKTFTEFLSTCDAIAKLTSQIVTEQDKYKMYLMVSVALIGAGVSLAIINRCCTNSNPVVDDQVITSVKRSRASAVIIQQF